MNRLLPIFIKLENQPCLVIGGGKIAGQKIKQLLESKADVTVKSLEISDLLILFRASSPRPGVVILEPGFINFVPLPNPLKNFTIPPTGIACALKVSKSNKNKHRHVQLKYDLVLLIIKRKAI